MKCVTARPPRTEGREMTDSEEPIRRDQYKDRAIRLVSYQLADGRWLPKAQIITSTGVQEHVRTIAGDATKAVESRDKADAIALVIAKQVIDAA
jgi:hypothetical protein